jgi:hypothetical protein
MTTSKFVSQLESSIKRLESLVLSLQSTSLHPSKTQYLNLAALELRLKAVAVNLPIQVEALKKRRAEASVEKGSKLIGQAHSEKVDLITTGLLKYPEIFARNITYFFNGQEDSVVDSDDTKARKKLTRERCKRICNLSCDGIIFWAAAFKPTTWTANLMSNDTFDYVLGHIESDVYEAWPPDVYRILSGLGIEEPLRRSQTFHDFLKGKFSFARS